MWQEPVFPVTLLSHLHFLVTAMWQQNNLPVTHNSQKHNKYDSVTGKMPKNFFYANDKIHRQIMLLSRLFFDVSYYFIITKIVAVPIQVQSSSNSSPIGDWNYMGLELVIPMFKSYSAEKKQRFLQENHLFLWWK